MPTELVWRLGHVDAPLEYPPHRVLRWQHRFDDPEHRYRTLYCARERITCLREVLADLRPNARAIAEFRTLFGTPPPIGVVSWAWRRQNVLACGSLQLRGPLVNLDDVAVRHSLENRHAELLAAYGIEHLYISEVRGTQRAVTQRIGRSLYEEGAAGVLYGSNRDDTPCIALFEGFASLVPYGSPEVLTRPIPELLQACAEYGLMLEGPPVYS